MERRKKDRLTQSDFHDLGCIMKMHGVNERHTEAGRQMHNECRALYFYLKELIKLNKNLKFSKPIINENEMDSTTTTFRKAEDTHSKNKTFRSHVATSLLKAIVAKHSTGVNNLQMEGKLIDFYRCLRTINKKSTAFVAANFGLEFRGMSDRWLSELNKKDRGENIFKCEVTNIYNNIKTMIEAMMTESNERITFSVAIDGTKVPKSLNINAAHKCIMGGVHPNHLT